MGYAWAGHRAGRTRAGVFFKTTEQPNTLEYFVIKYNEAWGFVPKCGLRISLTQG